MFSRRVATFLLGIWLGGCLFADALALHGSSQADRVLNNPDSTAARQAIEAAGGPASALLLRHVASEQLRATFDVWESAQLLLAVVLLLVLILNGQRKLLAIAGCAAMAVIAAIQHFLLAPEMNFLGRQLDFLSDADSFSLATRAWTLRQMYGGAELLKLVLGGALASYLFVMESVMKRGRPRTSRRAEADLPSASLHQG